MANGWTDARRKRHAQAIYRWRPWEQATGPKTPAGKARCARNAYRGSQRDESRRLARDVRHLMAQMAQVLDGDVLGAE